MICGFTLIAEYRSMSFIHGYVYFSGWFSFAPWCVRWLAMYLYWKIKWIVYLGESTNEKYTNNKQTRFSCRSLFLPSPVCNFLSTYIFSHSRFYKISSWTFLLWIEWHWLFKVVSYIGRHVIHNIKGKANKTVKMPRKGLKRKKDRIFFSFSSKYIISFILSVMVHLLKHGPPMWTECRQRRHSHSRMSWLIFSRFPSKHLIYRSVILQTARPAS